MITYTGGRITSKGWSGRRHESRVDATFAEDLAIRWREVAEAVGIGRSGASAAGIPFTTAPVVTHVDLTDPVTLTVRLLAGQLPGDVTAVSHRLAAGMGVAAVRVRAAASPDYLHVTLLDHDPLGAVVPVVGPVRSALDPITLGLDETGSSVNLELRSAAHLIVQGATGSGKSVGMYSMLSQLSAAPDVRVTGVDPTGLLLSPWSGWRPGPSCPGPPGRTARSGTDVPSPAIGTTNPMSYLVVLNDLVKEMDHRIAGMPKGRDSVDLGVETPVVLVVLEEYPGILRILDNTDPKLGKTFRALVGRLLAEGRKAGVRVVLLTQRADAAIIGAYERGQASHRISYRVDSIDGLRMLHPDITPDHAGAHVTAPAGVALLTAPGLPLTRFRSPFLPYSDYCEGLSA